MSKMNPVVHFEMPAEDGKRMTEFYTKTFGWNIQQYGPEMGNYMVVATSETDEKGHPVRPGNIGGGFYPKPKDGSADHPSVVIAVDDINESVKKIKAGGGTLLGEPANIPGVGMYVSFKDTEGNRLSILQPSEM